MIIYRTWEKVKRKNYVVDKVYECKGIFLFGIIPLYIKRVEVMSR